MAYPPLMALSSLRTRVHLPRFKDLPLGLQLFHGFALVLLALAALGVLSYRSAQYQRRAGAAAMKELTAHELSDSMFVDLFNMETSFRGFLVTGNEEYLATYRASADTFASKLARVYSPTLSSSDELRRWQQLDALVSTWQHDVVDPGIRSRRLAASSVASADPSILSDVLAHDKAQFDRIRQVMTQAKDAEQKEQEGLLGVATSASDQLRLILVWTTAGAGILSLFVAFMLARSIVASMAVLARTSDAIQKGDLDRRTALDRKDEIGQASLAFDRMAEQLHLTLQERELKAQIEAQERAVLALILDSMNEAVYEVDGTGRLSRTNEGTVRLTGQETAGLIGKNGRDVFCLEDESGRLLDEDEYPCQRALITGKQQEATNVYFSNARRKRIPLAITSTPIFDARGWAVGAVQVVRDISREVEANKLKDQIISLVSHELRTPITHIKGFASSLLESDIVWDPATIHDFIAEINNEADRLSALVSDILDISKIEAGGPIERKPFQPAAIANRAVRAVQSVTIDHVVLNEVGEDLPEMLIDGSQIERVLCNLLENAAKYSPVGTEIRLTAALNSEHVEWRVEDRGSGVPPEYRQRIFEKFFRIPGQGSRTPGTGLGLPICKGIVEAHGGRLWVRDRKCGGSRFCFSIPSSEELPKRDSGPATPLASTTA